jgi:hydrogenase-1 operon protein HyaF
MFDASIPTLNLSIGPGSQSEGDMVLDYMKMPSEMNTYDVPVLPEAHEMASCPHAMSVLNTLQTMLDRYRVGQNTEVLPLNEMPDADLEMLNQILGEGEVSVLLMISQQRQIRIQETVMAGVWRLREVMADQTVRESLEVADIPAAVRQFAFIAADKKIDLSAIPKTVLNAPSVLVELADASASYSKKKATDLLVSETNDYPVVNLTLLPFSPEDHSVLNEQLGTGSVMMLSRGYGNCRITSTQIPGIWRVQYFNSTDQLILDTLEVIDIPLVACAAQEDIDDSTERLNEIRDVFVEPHA